MISLFFFRVLLHLCPSKYMRRKIKLFISLMNNNNQLLFIDNGKEKRFNIFCNIQKITVSIKGNNNTIRLPQNNKIYGLRIEINGNNNFLELKESKYEFGKLSEIILENGAKLTIGKDCFVTSRLFIHAEGPNTHIKIGNNCFLARETTIRNTDSHTIYDKNNKQKILNSNSSVTIGNHVWITPKCTILKGVTLADNCIVGTNSIVTKSFNNEYCIIAGNPAKIVKTDVNWDERTPSQYSACLNKEI